MTKFGDGNRSIFGTLRQILRYNLGIYSIDCTTVAFVILSNLCSHLCPGAVICKLRLHLCSIRPYKSKRYHVSKETIFTSISKNINSTHILQNKRKSVQIILNKVLNIFLNIQDLFSKRAMRGVTPTFFSGLYLPPLLKKLYSL